MFIFILPLIEKQPGFGVLLKVEADRLSDWNEQDLHENQKNDLGKPDVWWMVLNFEKTIGS